MAKIRHIKHENQPWALSWDARSTYLPDFAIILEIGEMAIQRITISPVKGSQNVVKQYLDTIEDG